MTDPIVDAVCAKLQARSAVGLKKYGTTLADNPATVKEKLVHIQEELMDGANYVEWLLQEKEMPTPMTIEMEVTKTPENVTCVPASKIDDSPIEALQMVCNAFKELKIYGIDSLIEKIRAALQSPRVPVIDVGVMAMIETANENPSAFSHDALAGIIARAYAELQKGN